jgi:chaperonin GroES
MKHRIQPGPGRIAVQAIEEAELSESGLWIPPSARNDGHIGTVIAVAEPYTIDGVPHEPDYQVGDKVVFGKYTGSEIAVGSGRHRTNYIILKEQEILCTLIEEPDDVGA